MTTTRVHATALLAAFALAFAAMVAPVTAQEVEDDDDEASSEVGALGVEARPAIVAVGGPFAVEAEYEVEADESDDEAEEDESEGTEDGAGASTTVPASVGFSVDFGDGTPPAAMTITEEQSDAEEFEAEALATHQYAAEGQYVVTVTATPSTGEPTVGNVHVAVGRGGARMSGEDRFATSTRLSREAFPTDGSANAVLLARSDSFADALAAGTLTLLEDAPVLLTDSATVQQSVLDEIARALGDTGTVYLLGGEAAVSPAVGDAVAALGYTVERIAGDDRIDTAIQIARFLVDSGAVIDEVILASAGNFPDALAGASYAGEFETPVLLTAPDALDSRVRDLLTDLGSQVEVLILGGEAAVSPAVSDAVAALGNPVERLAGDDRFETSAVVAQTLFSDATAVVIATGRTFPDALSASALAARLHAPVLLVGDELSQPVRDYLQANAAQVDVVYVLGGRNAVTETVRAQVEVLLNIHG